MPSKSVNLISNILGGMPCEPKYPFRDKFSNGFNLSAEMLLFIKFFYYIALPVTVPLCNFLNRRILSYLFS